MTKWKIDGIYFIIVPNSTKRNSRAWGPLQREGDTTFNTGRSFAPHAPQVFFGGRQTKLEVGQPPVHATRVQWTEGAGGLQRRSSMALNFNVGVASTSTRSSASDLSMVNSENIVCRFVVRRTHPTGPPRYIDQRFRRPLNEGHKIFFRESENPYDLWKSLRRIRGEITGAADRTVKGNPRVSR